MQNPKQDLQALKTDMIAQLHSNSNEKTVIEKIKETLHNSATDHPFLTIIGFAILLFLILEILVPQGIHKYYDASLYGDAHSLKYKGVNAIILIITLSGALKLFEMSMQ